LFSSRFAPAVRSLAHTVANLALALIVFAATCAPAAAMPIFAQRYHLLCEQCHTAMPELNAFGTYFRNHGYRLPKSVPRHGTTIAALRYNLEYENDPAPGTRRFSPAASILSNADIGAISAYLHYSLGAGGAPANVFLGYLSTYNDHTQSLYRLGLYELPLTQSPGQRLDSITQYGYLGTTVGQNDLSLSAPRLGLEAERVVGQVRLEFSFAAGEFKGAAYGGKPVDTGTVTVAAHPEIEAFAQAPILAGHVMLNAEGIEGTRGIHLPGLAPFDDPYERLGFGFQTAFFAQKLDFEGQQWYGRDNDANGPASPVDSSGGYVRLKYFITPHLYAAARYDATAAPFAARDLVVYAGALVFRHARIILERRNNLLGGTPTFGGYLTIAAPWPGGY
jgi:hypothetical protein